MIFFRDNLQSISVCNGTKVSNNGLDNKLSLHNSWGPYIWHVHTNPPRLNVVTIDLILQGK